VKVGDLVQVNWPIGLEKLEPHGVGIITTVQPTGQPGYDSTHRYYGVMVSGNIVIIQEKYLKEIEHER